MENTRLIFLLVGAAFLIWGLLILLNVKFYVWWRNIFWKEPKDGHLSKESYFYNRYIEGGCEAALGAWIVYLMLFMH
jgi:hypothetical protein